MNMADRYPNSFPRCIRCKRFFTVRHLEQGKCHECHNACPAYVTVMVWGVIAALAIGLCTIAGCAGYNDGQDIMEQYRAGNFRLATSYYDYQRFLQTEESYE